MTLLYKILSISIISVICANKMFAQSDSILYALPDTTYNNTIKDTIVLEYSKGYARFETIRREGDKYFAVTSDNKDVEITSMINGKTRALVQDGDGHENDTLNLTIGTTGKQAIYAYDADSVIVGKLCIQAYDPKDVKSPPMAMGTQEAYSRMIRRRGRNIRIVYAQ